MKIEINSITYGPEYPTEFVSRLQNLILKQKESDRDTLYDPDHNNQRYKGNRYHNNERILQVILGNIRSSHETEFRKNGADWETAKNDSFAAALEWATTATDEDLSQLVKRALDYSAAADYWYKFEKEWE